MKSWRRPLLALIPFLALCGHFISGCDPTALDFHSSARQAAPADNEFLFCFWNVENFFDDRNDHRNGPGDKQYDAWFAEHPEILQLKLDKLTQALLSLNGGKGPDILAVAEVESVRAAQLLQQALNQKIADPNLHYSTVLMKEVSQGRHIAPAILTRLPVIADKTRTFGKRYRIIGCHVVVNGHELIVLASHWTSRLRGQETEHARIEYADKVYGAANAIYHANPQADILICGDFNDTPANVSVREHLHASGDIAGVKAGGEHLRLLDLMADKDPNNGFGTIYYRRWSIFDHIVASPGLLDSAGWSCDVDSVATINRLSRPGDAHHRPWHFGGPNERYERGYSDHFPVTVKLKVER